MVHATFVFDYKLSVEKMVSDNLDLYLTVYSQILKEFGKLDIVEEKFSSTTNPWLFLSFGAFTLSNIIDDDKAKGKGKGKGNGKGKKKEKKKEEEEKPFFLVEANVSILF